MMEMDGFDTVTAFLHTVPEWFALISLTFSIGTLVCRLWVLEASGKNEGFDQGDLLSHLWRFFAIGIAILIMSSIADLFVRAIEISGQPLATVSLVLPTVVLKTHIGHVWLIRMAALALLSITFVGARRYRDSRGLLLFMLGLALVVSMTESASGHASDKGDFSFSEMMDWLHLMAASVWGGGLILLSVVVLPELARQGEGIAPLNASVASRFSNIAGVAVGVVVVTSLYNAWSYVGSFVAFWKTPYGYTAAAKIFLFPLIMYLGAFNRYVSVPLLQQCSCYFSRNPGLLEKVAVRVFPRYLCTEEKSLIFSRFMLSVKVEAFLIILVLLCAALLRHEVPARHAAHMEHHGEKTHSAPHPVGEHMH
ncbi:MAG TPA: CopD family protein [Thermodesulfovibrionales bacterium]|nr:CopD family protein [Thermodesulfovibrionales bacterium]